MARFTKEDESTMLEKYKEFNHINESESSTAAAEVVCGRKYQLTDGLSNSVK